MPIYLTLLNGTGYVFDVEDYIELRTKHRVTGNFVGCSISGSGSGLPAELSIFETSLLVEEGIAQLVSKAKSLLRAPTDEEIALYAKGTEDRLHAQADLMKAGRLRDAERNIEQILEGKRKKLEKSGGPSSSHSEVTKETVLKEIADKFVFERKNALVEVMTAYPEPHEATVVQLPQEEELSPIDSLKYRVFKKYWQEGKYVTPGDAFGGDFLIYPADPMFYHASHIIIVNDRPTSVQLLDLISKVRLSVTVNKTFVIAYTTAQDTDNCDTINYLTVKWDGNIDDTLGNYSDSDSSESSSADISLPSSSKET